MVECQVRRELEERLGDSVHRLSAIPLDLPNVERRQAASKVAHLAKQALDRHVQEHLCEDVAKVDCHVPERLDGS